MDLSSIPLLQAINKKMSWLGERQQVLAQNVANADTPDYVAQDLKPLDFKSLLRHSAAKLHLVTTDAQHIATPRHGGGSFRARAVGDGERTLTGNNVDLEAEMMKVSETASDYQLATDLYRRQLTLFRTVLGHSGG
jgi:flagellar basal-body rod protein FlgB